MRFTIITSFYNYLYSSDELCSAIINQTYQNWEWLICDDFSENTEVIEKLRYLESLDDRIKIIYPKWKKQYYYNLPVEYSTGDIIVKIDSDDIPSVKLLEVYKYNYEKFPNVISIGSSSVFRKDNYDGEIVGVKYINYKNTSNFLESQKFEVTSSIGDARSFRIKMLKNNGIFVKENDFKFQRGEDINKILFVEEWGDFFAVPRILHHYTIRDDSNSGGKTVNSDISNEINEINQTNLLKMIDDCETRFNRRYLFSIEKFYDSSFDHLKNFYFSGIEFEEKKSNIEYWSNMLTINDMDKISTTYFDHNIYYNNKTNSVKYIVIDAFNNKNIIYDALQYRDLKDCIITISSNKDDRYEITNIIEDMGYHYWFNIFNYFTIKIKF